MYYKGKKISKIHSKIYTIDWTLGNYCNFNCVYCFDNSNTGTHKPPVDWEDAQIMIKNVTHMINEIKKIMPNDGKLQIIFEGGEPTVYKHFPKLCKAIKDIGVEILVLTNGSMPISWWKKHIDVFDDIQISSHTAEADLEHIKNLVELYAQYPYKKCGCSVIVGHHNYDKAIDWFNELKPIQEKRRQFSVRLATIRPTKRNTEYKPLTPEQLKFIGNLMVASDKVKENSPEVKATYDDGIPYKQGLPKPQMKVKPHGWRVSTYSRDEAFLEGNWVGYTCYAPTQFISIHEDFKLYNLACGQHVFDPPIYITDKGFIEKFSMPKPVVCSIDKFGKTCNCVGLYDTNKRL